MGFNREEDGLLGSTDFVAHGLQRLQRPIGCAHVLEMLGYTADTQRLPDGLPVRTPDDGRFLGLLSKGAGNRELARLVARAKAEAPDLPIVALHVYLGLDRFFPDLHRSDHAPFWAANLPAVLWTDTAELRNPHYHRPTDLPDTLDYPFLAKIADLLARTVGARER